MIGALTVGKIIHSTIIRTCITDKEQWNTYVGVYGSRNKSQKLVGHFSEDMDI